MTYKEKLFSIIIPTCKRDDSLRSTLLSLEKQPVDLIYEVIVVADGDSLPDVSAIILPVQLKVICTGKQMGPAYARNFGAKIARGKILVFIDDDIQLEKNALKRIGDIYSAADVPVAVSGHIIPAASLQNNIYMQFAYGGAVHTNSAPDFNQGYLHYCTSFAAVDRDTFVKLAGFDERFKNPGYEDVEFAFRVLKLNIPLRFVDDAIAYHFKQMDRAWFLQRCKQTGGKLHLFHAIQPDAKRWYHKLLFNRVNIAIAGMLSRIMLNRIEKIEKMSLGLDLLVLRVVHALSVMAAYAS